MIFSLSRVSKHEKLVVEILPHREALGLAAATRAAQAIVRAIAERGEARVIFACAPSQNEFLAALTAPGGPGAGIDWARVTAFHMDEYVGLEESRPQAFRQYLRRHLLDLVPVGRYHLMATEGADLATLSRRYGALLEERPIDLICLGIGENGHVAFNDPPVADFADPAPVKEVALDLSCRQQQVNDGCFARLEDVPRSALTLTVPVFMKARQLSIHVPGATKARAALAALHGPISTACPASILRQHPAARMYLDADSSALLPPSR